MAASLAVIVIHHLGYRGFHDRAALAPVMVGCGLLSLAYLLTASPLEVPPVLRRPDHLVPAGVAAFRLRW
jgi:hypothetical protein